MAVAHPRGRVHPKQAWEDTPGLETQPFCFNCGAVTVWRGAWVCMGCGARGASQQLNYDIPPSRLPREALAGVPIFSSLRREQLDASAPSRGGWLHAVESLTSMHRASRAADLLRRGTRRTETEDWSHDEDGVVTNHGPTTNGTPIVTRWHEQRIKGQAERFERVERCGTFENALDVTFEDGKTQTKFLRTKCECWRVCQKCLDKRKWKLSEGMKTQRELILRRHKSETHRRYRGPEGKWSEKLLTFTVPHGPQGPGHDARVIVDAWQQLLRRVRKHLLSRGASRISASGKQVAVSIPWCRALEVAPGDSGGHAHLHVWWYGPFLDAVLLRAWWGELLREAGVTGIPVRRWRELRAQGRDRRLASWLGNPSEEHGIPWPVVDIRRGDESASLYTQKVGVALYITKGTDTSRIEPAHAASIYETFEGVRAVQWARGWAPPKKPLRARCVSFRRLTEDEKSRLNRSVIHRNGTEETSNENAGLDSLLVGNREAVSALGADPNIRLDVVDRPNVKVATQLTLAIDIRKRGKYRKSW